ncbi:MAG: hypothetical protein IT210_06050 [Armatimonadetes bacterium]|nr:hypothetical protein [Armatimonadota bacterium]
MRGLVALILIGLALRAGASPAFQVAWQPGEPAETASPEPPSGDLAPMPPLTPAPVTGLQTSPAPEGVPPATRQSKATLEGDAGRVLTDSSVRVDGNVRFTYEGYTITSDRAEGNADQAIFLFEGNVLLESPTETVRAHRLTFNTRTRAWVVLEAKGRLEPGRFEGQVTEPVFVGGEYVQGQPEHIIGRKGSFTSCDLTEPHYHISAGAIEIYPGDRLIARKASLWLGDRRVLSLPTLIIPLRQILGRSPLVPQVGRSEDEGFFVKTLYNYGGTFNSYGSLKLDWLEKRGFGRGLEHFYRIAGGAGSVYLYNLLDKVTGKQNWTGRLQHSQKIGRMRASVLTDYRQNSYYYSSSSTTRNTELTFADQGHSTSTNLAIRQSATQGFGTYKTLSSNLQHSRSITRDLRTSLSLDYSRYESPSFGDTVIPPNEELNSRFEANQRTRYFDLQVNANKRQNLTKGGNQDSFFSTLDRLPEVLLTTDSYRFKSGFLAAVPSRIQLGYGRFREEPNHIETDRFLFDYDLTGKSVSLGSRTDLNFSSGFQQTAYGDNTAQYIASANATLSSRIGRESTAEIVYYRRQPHGYAPFRFDFANRYNSLNARYNFRDARNLRLTLYTGYDFTQDISPWQNLNIRMLYRPVSWMLLTTATSYNLNKRPSFFGSTGVSPWGAVTNFLQVRHPRGFNMDLATIYNTTREQMDTIRAQVETPLGRWWKIRALTSYSGQRKAFDYKHLLITRDLHCWEASLLVSEESSFIRSRREVRLDIRIKAFPFTQAFGVGQLGQVLDTSVGDVYGGF